MRTKCIVPQDLNIKRQKGALFFSASGKVFGWDQRRGPLLKGPGKQRGPGGGNRSLFGSFGLPAPLKEGPGACVTEASYSRSLM